MTEASPYAGAVFRGTATRLLEVVTAPTGEAVRFFAAAEGTGSAWISRQEAESMIEFLQDWLHSTCAGRKPASEKPRRRS